MYYSGFLPETTTTILKALRFARSKIQEHYEAQKSIIDKTHWNTIDQAMQTELREIDALTTFLNEHVMLTWAMDQKQFDQINVVIRSALDIYVADLRETKRQTGLSSFDDLITEAEQVQKIEAISKAKTGRFTNYYSPKQTESLRDDEKADKESAQRYLVFIAYDDGTGLDFAEHLKRELEKRHTPTFVARKDIPREITRGEGWREKIDPIIKTCNTFILILSTDKLSPEVTHETKLAFERNRRDHRFWIIVPRLKGMPRQNAQLLSAGIDSENFQQIDFETQYDLARQITSRLDERGFPRAPQFGTADNNAISPASPTGDFAIAQIGWYLFVYSWFVTWILERDFLFGFGLFGISSVITLIVAYAKRWTGDRIAAFCKRAFPAFLFVSICWLLSSLGLRYTLGIYPITSGLTFATYLADAPTVSLFLVLGTVVGGVLLDLPSLSWKEAKSTFTWIPAHKKRFVTAIALALVFTAVCANLAYMDSAVVLFTPKVTLVETRYATDGLIHITQTGFTQFSGWSQNQRIVNILTPLFPWVSETTYSFVTNSSMPPSLVGAYGLSASTPIEDSQDQINVQLRTSSTISSQAQFIVQFYTEYDNVRQFAQIIFSRVVSATLSNGTQQYQVRLIVVNHSAYALSLENIMLYAGPYAPTNQTLAFSQQGPVPLGQHYQNDTQSFILNGVLAPYGNLESLVTYNIP
jgi:hypothetical protein